MNKSQHITSRVLLVTGRLVRARWPFTFGKEIYFGEVLGKHSEIFGVLKDEEIERVDIPESDAEVLARHQGLICSGFDPLEYLRCGECQDFGQRLPDDGVCSYCRETLSE